jgi:hypothetical protein
VSTAHFCDDLTCTTCYSFAEEPEVLLTQYAVVRRDLPPMRMIIDVGHGCGESFYLFATLGLAPRGFNPDRTTLIVKGARNMPKLEKLERALKADNIPHIAVREPDEPWFGQLMAVVLVPGTKEAYSKYLRDYQPLNHVDVADALEDWHDTYVVTPDGKHDHVHCPEGFRGCQNCK